MGKYLAFILTLSFLTTVFVPTYVAAQTTLDGVEVRRAIPVNGNSQGNAYVSGQTGNAGGNNSAGTDFAADAVGCSAGQILGNIVANGVSGIIGSLTGSGSNSLSNSVSLRVPTQDADTPAIRDDQAASRAKEAGGGNPTLLGGFTSSLNVSWDSIGFCLANATIHYIAQSTINWINSGFEGNPAFVDNPGQFFQDVADTEAGGFIEELGGGFLCSEFAPKVRIALVNDYLRKSGGDPYEGRAQCSFTDASRNLESFLDDYRQGGLENYVEFVFNPANRAQSAYLQAQDELNMRLNKQQTQLDVELNWGRGFLSFKDCTNAPSKVVNGKTVKDTTKCPTKTPGQVIESELNNNLDMKYQRLSIADEFDEVVAALVNYLIKTALSETLTNDDRAGEFGTSDEGDNRDKAPSYYNPPSNPTSPVNPGTRPALTVTCRSSTDTARIGQSVYFYAFPSYYSSTGMSYSWFGGPDLPKNSVYSNIETKFPSAGITDVYVSVTVGSQTASGKCPAITITGGSTATTTPPTTTGSITLTRPNGGETIAVSSNQTIEWTSTNVPVGSFAQVSLIEGPTNGVISTQEVKTANKIAFKVPSNVISGTNNTALKVGTYRLKVNIYDKLPCAGFYCGEKLLATDTTNGTITISATLTGSCDADVNSSETGLPITWTVEPSGGTGTYSYLWKGSESLEGATSSSKTVTYSTKGKKTGSVVITSGAATKSLNCGSVSIN